MTTSLPPSNYYLSHDTDPQEDVLRSISRSAAVVRKHGTVVLIVPPSPQIPTPGREFLVTGPFEGFTYIATVIKKMGYSLKVIDCRLKSDHERWVLEGVKDAHIVGIATYCDSFIFLQEITRAIKARYPEKGIFFGGPLVTSLPEVLLKHTEADCAILGEGELTLIEFLQEYFRSGMVAFKTIKGMAYKDNGKVVINPPRPQIKDLDNLPHLDYTVWPNYDEILKNGQILISSMRGCPQECSFCFKTIPGLRLKSLERFEEEVAHLKKETGFDYTWLNDLTFNVIEERAIGICKILKKHGVRYHCFARVQKVTEKLVAVLKETGCLGIWFGIESCDQHVLDQNRKNIKVREIDHAVKVAQDRGLAVRGLFIVGLYGETERSLKEMVAFIKKSRFLPLVKYLVPFPGTSLYHYGVKTGKITDTLAFLKMLSLRKVSDHDDEIINLTDLSEETLRDYFHQVWSITKERESCYES
ncbi:MAG: radical SAM protein [Candidatus Omnitrophota bacterium]